MDYMFEKPNPPKQEKSVLGKAREGVRAALAGATLLGTVGATELPDGALGVHSHAEAQESFNFEKEARSFVEAVESMDVGIDDARGRHALRTKVDEKFSIFALACANRSPYYSATDNVSTGGSVTHEMRAVAGQYLLPRLDMLATSDNLAVEILRELISGQPSERLSSNPPSAPELDDIPGAQKSEVRRIKNNDW